MAALSQLKAPGPPAAIESEMAPLKILQVYRIPRARLIPVPANGELLFEPNDYHLMMMKPLKRFKAGDEIRAQQKFKDGQREDVTFLVRPLGYEPE